MRAYQLYLWKSAHYYECVNPQCFYNEAQFNHTEVVWKDMWNSDLGDLDMIPYCPSCQQEVIFWQLDTTDVAPTTADETRT